MAEALNKDDVMQGHLDGRPIKLRYHNATSDGKTLDWTDDGDEHGWAPIELDTIIALTTDGELLYVAEHDREEGSKIASTELKSITLDQPSKELAERFSLPFSSWLQDPPTQQQESQKLQIIVSVASGTRRASEFSEKALLPLLRKLKVQHEVHTTTSESHILELTKSKILPAANAGIRQHIILLSGDGGLVDILNALHSLSRTSKYTSPDIALIPMGTGNALANSTGLLSDKTYGLKTLLRGHPHELPAFTVTFSSGARFLADEARVEEEIPTINGALTAYGCVVCSWGLHAALVADSDTQEYRKFGADRFKMAAKEALFPADGSPPHEYKGTVSFVPLPASKGTWKTIDRASHGYVLSTPVSHLEAGFNISPASKPFDGVLRLVHFAPLSGERAMGIMGKAYQSGAHVKEDEVGYEAVQAIRIGFNEADAHWRRVCIDGKIARIDKGGWIEVRSVSNSGVNVVAT